MDTYPDNLKNRDFGCAKAPGLNDRKSVHISNPDFSGYLGITAAIVTRAFLHKCFPEQRSALIHYLPPHEAEQIENLPDTMGDPAAGFSEPEELVEQVHFSWLGPVLRTFPETEIRLFLACLNKAQIKGLKQQLLFSNHFPVLSPLAHVFLKKNLAHAIAPDDLLPAACLPANRLNGLLKLNHAELLSLIDLLSIHDLAAEVRHIIDTLKLKQIYSLLSKPQHAYLKTLLHKKEPVVFKKMGLSHWNGDLETLRSILLQRGINRLAKALFGHHPSLIWYVAHHLDMGKGEMLNKLCSSLDHPRAAAILGDQIADLVDSMKSDSRQGE